MRTKDMFPSKYLQSADAKTKQIITTISRMELELVGQGQDQKKKPVLYLEDQKPMVLNRTNTEARRHSRDYATTVPLERRR